MTNPGESLSDADIESLRDAVATLAFRKEEPYDGLLWLTVLAKLRRNAELQAIFAAAEDKAATQAKIDQAIGIGIGRGYSFTGHGIARNLGSLYSDEDLAIVFTKIAELCNGLERHVGVQAFVTSGTLLGLIRDGRVIPHDDDFDLAYVSAQSDPEEILAERIEVFAYMKTVDKLNVKRNGGHLGASFQDGRIYAYMDLFTGWVGDGYFNEDPLDPNIIRARDVIPIKKMNFYGVDVNVPQNPEALLKVNYGEGWRYPDPSFRFDFGKNGAFYSFLNRAKDRHKYE